MSLERTLARVEAELQAGELMSALGRLRGLRGTYPQNLEVRDRLAEVYRRVGDPVQAGRWAYLAEHRLPDETAAFERAFGRDPVRLMGALRWSGSEDDAATEIARQRLTEVRTRAERHAGRKLMWERPHLVQHQTSGWVGCLAFALIVLFFAGVFLVGLVTIVGSFT